MKATILIIMISLFFCFFCSEHSTEGNSSANNLIPFKVGNYWEYKTILYDTLGNIRDIHYGTSRIIKDTVIFNLHFYKYDNSTIHFITKEDGIWIYKISYTGDEEHSLYLKYPCKTGDTYRFTLGRPPCEVSVLSTKQQVQVEAGTFSCIVYHFKLDSMEAYNNYYYAPGVGEVKGEVFDGRVTSTTYKSSESQLIRYQLY